MTVLLRFAPSPTGFLHLGGLRTALYNHLFARKHGGKWILRIEDTDATRFVPGSVANIRESLEWARLDYDFGPGKGGPHAPYFQSDRLDLYHTYAQKLLDSGHAYRCFCSPTRLSAIKQQLQKRGSNATYDKACLHLTEEEVARRVKNGDTFTIRLNDGSIPPTEPLRDLIFGDVKDAHSSLPTDPILIKSDKYPTYHLANVVDDHEMGITHVLRGEEWLPSLPLHLDLYACLSLKPPSFGHIPLLLNADGSKMSKRSGDVSVADYIEAGWERPALLNWLALAGWGTSTQSKDTNDVEPEKVLEKDEVLNMADLIRKFDISRLTNRRSCLWPGKLSYLNRQHIVQMAIYPPMRAELADRLKALVKEKFPNSDLIESYDFKRIILNQQGRVLKINDIPSATEFLYIRPDYSSEDTSRFYRGLPAKEYLDVLVHLSQAMDKQPWAEDILHRFLLAAAKDMKLKSKTFMSIIRHALMGGKPGMSVAGAVFLLGREETKKRIKLALDASIRHTAHGNAMISLRLMGLP